MRLSLVDLRMPEQKRKPGLQQRRMKYQMLVKEEKRTMGRMWLRLEREGRMTEGWYSPV